MPAQAQRVRIDDSLSPVDTFAVQLSWGAADLRRALNALMAGTPDAGPPMTGRVANVELRLDTREFVGDSARIYLTLPPLIDGLGSPPGLELSWQASGAFLPGAVVPGQSTLVFDGVIDAPVMSASFSFMLSLQGGAESEVFDVEPYYELEVLP